ncbi:MAG TPA: hypothetical protein VFZ32_15490 [Micromonosporaceae bacterium]
MRHLISLLLGLVIAPAVWIAAGLGQAKLIQATDSGLTLRGATVPLVALAAAGLVFGVIATTRVSPAGPLTAGLLIVGIQVAYLARPERITELLPEEILGTQDVLTLPAATGLGAVLGVGLMVAIFSLGRWRNWPYDDSPSYAFLGDSGPVGAATPSAARKAYGDESTSSFSTVSDETTHSLAGASTGTDSTSNWSEGPAWRRSETDSEPGRSTWTPPRLR